MERLITYFGMTAADAAEVTGFFIGIIIISVIAGNVILWLMKETFEMLCSLISLVADMIKKQLKKRSR